MSRPIDDLLASPEMKSMMRRVDKYMEYVEYEYKETRWP